jgi:hypothetical protein
MMTSEKNAYRKLPIEGLAEIFESKRCIRKAAPLLQPGGAGARRKSHSSGVQQDGPLIGASVGFRFGLPDGRIVKLSGPFEVEVLRNVSQFNAPSRLVCLG